jgi:hypothetical protein
VTSSGVEYDGKTYRSLSDVVRTITGTRWSGPGFFVRSQKAKAGLCPPPITTMADLYRRA